MSPYLEDLIAAKQQLGLSATLQGVLWIKMDETISTPAIGFEPPVIDFLRALGGSIDVDTYRV